MGEERKADKSVGGIWAVVPVKLSPKGKTRLADILTPEERLQLARIMLEDVLTALTATPGLAGVLVVAGDEDSATIAKDLGAHVLTDSGGGTNAAVEAAANHLEKQGAEGMLILHADLPLANSADLARVLGHLDQNPAVVLVPEGRGDGTNCLACRPPRALAFGFGTDSFVRHQVNAEKAGIRPVVLDDMSRLALDLDTPADLRDLLARAEPSRSRDLLIRWNLPDRLVDSVNKGLKQGP